MTKIRFVGLDVYADTIAVAVAEPTREVRAIGIIPNRLESEIDKLKSTGAGPFLILRQNQGASCGIIATRPLSSTERAGVSIEFRPIQINT